MQLIGNAKCVKMKPAMGYFLKPRRRGMEITSEEKVKLILIKINPIYAKMLTQDLSEVSTGIFESEMEEGVISRLEQAAATEDLPAIDRIIDAEINLRSQLHYINATVAESIERIKHTSGTITVKEIYSSLNVSKSKLEQHFNKEIGLTPKEFCKIEKINYFINSYKKRPEQNLTALTYKCGYYDQSHLIKDFRYFLDTSPKKFFAMQEQTRKEC